MHSEQQPKIVILISDKKSMKIITCRKENCFQRYKFFDVYFVKFKLKQYIYK